MRIVQLIENLELGGLERLAVDLAIAQSQAGHQVLVYCLFSAGALAAPLQSAGIPIVTFDKAPGFSLGTVFAMAKRLRADRVEVLHGHNPGVHHYAALAAKLARVPVCINTWHSVFNSQGNRYQERFFRWVKPFTSHVVFICDYVRRGIEPGLGFPPAKCSTIRNGIPLEPFLSHPAAPGSRAPAIRLGTIGRLVPAKGHAVLIEAFARICRQVPDASLTIFGYGALEEELRTQIARLVVEDRVHLAGRADDSAATLQGFDIFVFSSVNEGLPLVILEAMAAGLPIVSTNVGGIPEVLPPESAWLCPPGDAPALADTMLQAIQCSTLRQRGDAARQLASSAYGLEHMARRYDELYRRLLS